MNYPYVYPDPRLIAAAQAEAAARNQRRGPRQGEEASEVANYLLSLKHRNGDATDAQLAEMAAQEDNERRMLLQQAHLRAAVAQGYPPMYGIPHHHGHHMDMRYMDTKRAGTAPAPSLLEEPIVSETAVDALIKESKLVKMKDRDLVPDALFVAMGQIIPTQLSQADRVGCYKSRELGFVGMCCKHCGGQPGFGRYFPNSVRSLAQTTTSQTILKHIASKCRFCPPHVRQAVLDLQRQQAAKEGMAAGRPRYGSRKIFFQRLWARLHGSKTDEFETDDDEDSKIGEQEESKDEGLVQVQEGPQIQPSPLQKRKTPTNASAEDNVPEAKRACV